MIEEHDRWLAKSVKCNRNMMRVKSNRRKSYWDNQRHKWINKVGKTFADFFKNRIEADKV